MHLLMGIAPMILPALLIWVFLRFPKLEKTSLIAFVFIVGISLAFLLSYLQTSQVMTAQQMSGINAVQSQVLNVSIALALPMLIFSFDIRQAVVHAKQLLLSMTLVIIATCFMTVMATLLFSNQIHHIADYAGMALGAYVGGGVNMAVIKTAVNADEAVFITMTSYDILMSSVYLLLVLTALIPIVNRFLYQPHQEYPKTNNQEDTSSLVGSQNKMMLASQESAKEYLTLLQKKHLKHNGASIVIAGIIVGISVVLAGFLPKAYVATATIVLISSIAILVSTISKVNQLPTSYRLGMYLVMVFCATAGSMMKPAIFTSLNTTLIWFLAVIIFSSFLLHLLLAKVFKIDAHTFLVTNVASVMSLPFIPLICNRINARYLLISGIAVSIIGYILGSYLGILMVSVIKAIL